MQIGRHIIAELYGVEERLIAKQEEVERLVWEVVRESELHAVSSAFKQFEPHGVAGVVLLSESHISVHTWPEYKLVNLDVFTCGDPSKAEKAFELFLRKFKPRSHRIVSLDRG